ncbi:hypothetical protein EST38_g13598 [Candolleomyces aberdarensis]|uniref:HNH nuclease domain-containing protein n=1 Tax=Candolleomyces aberdarensis TaxID=2316362 RepID=A0A4V1Q1P0_9AGAR|nr:hypothetical protein EST38_g13598 [Candolleomyces aberdarensis]
MTQLSSTLPPRLQNNSSYTSAYNQILGLENSLQTRINAGETLRSDMIACRILGNLIHFAPTDEARSVVIRDILSAGGDSEKMLDSGKRCVITGDYDLASLNKCPELVEEAGPKPSWGVTELCHIFSALTSANLESGDKRIYAATAYTIAELFGYTTIQQDLNGEKIHRLENVMTMRSDFHTLFDGLALWLVEVGKDTYKVETSNQVVNQSHGGREVKFTTENPEELPVPSPEYLVLHTACAKVAHLSGAAEYIETILRDAEEIPVLAADGSSGEVLTHLLRHVVA